MAQHTAKNMTMKNAFWLNKDNGISFASSATNATASAANFCMRDFCIDEFIAALCHDKLTRVLWV